MAVASPDKDFFQLLRPGVILLRPPRKPAPGERVNKYALVPYSAADFEQARGAWWAGAGQPQGARGLLGVAGGRGQGATGKPAGWAPRGPWPALQPC